MDTYGFMPTVRYNAERRVMVASLALRSESAKQSAVSAWVKFGVVLCNDKVDQRVFVRICILCE